MATYTHTVVRVHSNDQRDAALAALGKGASAAEAAKAAGDNCDTFDMNVEEGSVGPIVYNDHADELAARERENAERAKADRRASREG